MLDPTFCVALLRGNAAARQWFARQPLDGLFISVVVEMELHAGVLAAGNPSLEAAKVQALLSSLILLPWDSAVARATAEAHHRLAGQGNLMEAADTLIAGHALSLGHTLVTADKHLLQRAPILGLRIEDYRAVK